MTTTTDAKHVVDQYNRALEGKDFAAARGFLADDLRFEGPIDHFEKADDYITAITRLHGMVKGVEHQKTISNGDEVALFYLLDTAVAKAPVAEWYTVRSGKIVHLRAYFDARPFSPPSR
jgi:limonene-1,2-epoxide hydrolase